MLINLLRTIGIIILVMYTLRILGRLFAPYMIRYVAKKAEKRFAEQFKQQAPYQQEQAAKEGETTIDKMPQRNPSKGGGEYIDFEEVDWIIVKNCPYKKMMFILIFSLKFTPIEFRF